MNKAELEKSMELMKKGSEQGFDMMYQITSHQVFILALSILKDESLAEEAMQDAYIKIRNNIQSYKKNTNPWAWILTITRRSAINYYNQRKKEVSIDVNAQEYLFGSISTQLDNKIYLQQALLCLSATERQIIVLRAIGYKHKDISKIVKKPLGTVLWIYNQSVKKMSARMNR